MMFVPGNNPGMMADAHIYGPDSIMLDLEDSVTMAEKDAARLLVYNALKSIDYGTTEMVVRINPLSTPYGRKDVEAVVKAGVDVIRMPKTETADEVRELEAEIIKVETELGCVGRTLIMAAIESALGVVNAYEIATASKRMMGIALGAEDYSASLKTQRTPGGSELLLARETIVVAARAAGISCFDTVYSNLRRQIHHQSPPDRGRERGVHPHSQGYRKVAAHSRRHQGGPGKGLRRRIAQRQDGRPSRGDPRRAHHRIRNCIRSS